MCEKCTELEEEIADLKEQIEDQDDIIESYYVALEEINDITRNIC